MPTRRRPNLRCKRSSLRSAGSSPRIIARHARSQLPRDRIAAILELTDAIEADGTVRKLDGQGPKHATGGRTVAHCGPRAKRAQAFRGQMRARDPRPKIHATSCCRPRLRKRRLPPLANSERYPENNAPSRDRSARPAGAWKRLSVRRCARCCGLGSKTTSRTSSSGWCARKSSASSLRRSRDKPDQAFLTRRSDILNTLPGLTGFNA